VHSGLSSIDARSGGWFCVAYHCVPCRTRYWVLVIDLLLLAAAAPSEPVKVWLLWTQPDEPLLLVEQERGQPD